MEDPFIELICNIWRCILIIRILIIIIFHIWEGDALNSPNFGK